MFFKVYSVEQCSMYNIDASGGCFLWQSSVESVEQSVEVVRGKRSDISGKSSRTKEHYYCNNILLM